MTLDPAGLEAAAKALQADRGAPTTHAGRYDSHRAIVAVRAYLAAAQTLTENPACPYFEGEGHNDLHGAWHEGFAAGRAAATDTIPREDALQALHEMSTVAGLLRIREDDPAVVALGDRLRLACRALRDVTAPGMNELMDSQPGRAAATPDPPRTVLDPETGIEEPVTTGRIPDAEFVEPPLMPAAASPDERLREAVRDFLDGVFEGDGRWDRLHAALAAADREKPERPSWPEGLEPCPDPDADEWPAPPVSAGSDGEDR